MRLLWLLVLLVTAFPVTAETLRVCDNCDFKTIQDAVNASQEGWTIFVSSGVYRENLVISKPIRILGEDKTKIEPTTISLPTVRVVTTNFSIENVCINNGTTGLELVFVGEFYIKNCKFDDNLKAIHLMETSNGLLENLEIQKFVDGLVVDTSRDIEIRNSLFREGNTAVRISTSNGIVLQNLSIFASKGLESSNGEGNVVKNSVFSGDIFISTFSENRLISSENEVSGIFAVEEGSSGSIYLFNGLDLSGENFQISLENISLPERFVKLGDALNATVIPNVYTERGAIYLESNFTETEFENLDQINISSIAFYRYSAEGLERVSELYNSTSGPLSYTTEKSGIYVLAAEKAGFEGAPEVVKTPGFELLIGFVALLLALLWAKRS